MKGLQIFSEKAFRPPSVFYPGAAVCNLRFTLTVNFAMLIGVCMSVLQIVVQLKKNKVAC